ncbi:MAG: recombinase family protein [Epsilonproteobacteria bacterium]|nr:recombinase family protein [Campylobacterota bacterium]
MVYAYMRQIPTLENLVTQKNEILAFSHQKNIDVTQEVVEYATKDLLIDERKEFENFLKSLGEGKYTVIVSSLAVLGTRVDELVKVLNCMLSHDVDLWVCDANLLINTESHMTKVFPLLEEQRKIPSESTQIGRPKGSKSSSKFDVYHGEIMTMLAQKQSVSAIARTLEVSRSSLKDYIESRRLKSLVASIGNAVETLEDKEVDNIVLICPFERDELHEKRTA